MKNKSVVTVSQFFICIFLCNLMAVFGIFGGKAEANPFWFNIFTALTGILLFLLFCLPAVKISDKTAKPYSRLLSAGSPSLGIILKLFYALCFVVFASVAVAKYGYFMKEQINSELSLVVLGAVFAALGGFCCYRGVQPLFRTAVILIVFALVAIIFIFSGLLSSFTQVTVDYKADEIAGYIKSSGNLIIFSLIPASAFIVFYDSLKGSKRKGVIACAAACFTLFFITGLFIFFVLDDFSKVTKFPAFTLAKISRISMLKGGEGFLFAAVTASLFLFVFLFFSCCSKLLEKSHSKTLSAAISAGVFIVTTLMFFVPALYDFLSDPIFLLIINTLITVIIPLTVYGIRKKEGLI